MSNWISKTWNSLLECVACWLWSVNRLLDQGRQQLKLLADIEVTTKAVERTAEAIGEDIAAREQQEIQRAVQLDLPIVVGEPVPILYVLMDGTGIPVTKRRRKDGRSA
jgi:hypothetical protein